MRCLVVLVSLVVCLLSVRSVDAGHRWGGGECTGFSAEMCRSNYDPDIHDQMFIRNIDQFSAQHSANMRPAITTAAAQWNTLGAGPQSFSIEPEINDSFNFLKPKTAAEVRTRTMVGASPVALTMFCTNALPGDMCTPDLLIAVVAEWTEIWVVVSYEAPIDEILCLPCKPYIEQRHYFAHEFGHALGLAHHGDPGETLMSGVPDGFNKVPGTHEAGSLSDCKQGSPDLDEAGLRCIYDWYDCLDFDCDSLGITDNCPSAPNETQRDYDGERLDLGAEAAFDDWTNASAYDSTGDVCDPDDDGDGLTTTQELAAPCASSSGFTDPLDDDSDNDYILDGAECVLGSNPRSAASKPATTPDADSDGLADHFEAFFGTNPNSPDTESDGALDGREILRYRTSPLLANSDGARCLDVSEMASINTDYNVNAIDLNMVSIRFGPYPAGDRVRRTFDFTRDGVVSSVDLSQVAKFFGPCP